MKKIITLMLVLALAGTIGTTAAFAAPEGTGVETPDQGQTQTDKVLLKVNCFGDGQIVGTDDGSEPVFDDEYPYIAIAVANKGGTIGAYTEVLKLINYINDVMNEYKEFKHN